MTAHRSRRRPQFYGSFAVAFIASCCLAHDASAQYNAAAELGRYLHYKTGMHEYMYGPGGIVQRYGLPLQPPPPPGGVRRVIVIRRARCEALNVQVTVPGQAWKAVDPKSVGSRTSFLLTRRNPDLTISLAGERVGVEADETNRSLLAASQAKMRNLPGAILVPGQQPLSGQNIQGFTYQASAEQDGTAAHYAIWVASRNGYNYKVAVYGQQKYKPAINATMRNFVQNFRQINSKQIAHAEKKKVATAYLSLDADEKAPEEPQPFAETLVK